MRKFKALLKKDWYIHKKSILIPFWIIAAFYLINIIFITGAYFSGNLDTIFQNDFEQVPADAVSFIANSVITLFPGLLLLLFVIITTQGALNEDRRLKYELFHRSQPVSIWQMTASKFSVGVLGNYLIFIIISILNAMVLNVILFNVDAFHFSSALYGMLFAQLIYLKGALIIGAFAFFMSSIFESAAFFKFISIMIALNIIILIINGIYGWQIPTPMKYFRMIINTMPAMDNLSNDNFLVSEIIKASWKGIVFSMQTLYQLIAVAVLYAGGTFIYSRKEIA